MLSTALGSILPPSLISDPVLLVNQVCFYLTIALLISIEKLPSLLYLFIQESNKLAHF
nr:MAG TPA: hypothetical protein [Caudoviricetes sp.]